MVSKIFIFVLVILTIVTSGLAVTKVIEEQKEIPLIPEIIPTITQIPTQLPTLLPTAKLVPTKIILPTQTSVSANQCIIAVSGQQYNVTALRSSHSGGDIFQCGTDMTNVYQKRHGNGLSLIQRYLITGSVNSVLPTAMPQSGGRGREDDDD